MYIILFVYIYVCIGYRYINCIMIKCVLYGHLCLFSRFLLYKRTGFLRGSFFLPLTCDEYVKYEKKIGEKLLFVLYNIYI